VGGDGRQGDGESGFRGGSQEVAVSLKWKFGRFGGKKRKVQGLMWEKYMCKGLVPTQTQELIEREGLFFRSRTLCRKPEELSAGVWK